MNFQSNYVPEGDFYDEAGQQHRDEQKHADRRETLAFQERCGAQGHRMRVHQLDGEIRCDYCERKQEPPVAKPVTTAQPQEPDEPMLCIDCVKPLVVGPGGCKCGGF